MLIFFTVANQVIIGIDKVNATIAGRRVLRDISWQLKKGENWLCVGPNGSGKTSFLRLLKGTLWPAPESRGARRYFFNGQSSESPVGLERTIAFLSPELINRFRQGHGDLTGEEAVLTGFEDSLYLYRKPGPAELEKTRTLLGTFGLMSLRRKSLDKLSQGQLCRILLLRAFVRGPSLLLLDEFCNGVDAEGEREALEFVEKLARAGAQIIMTAHRSEAAIPSISHVVRFHDRRIAQWGPRGELSLPEEKRPAAPKRTAGIVSPPNPVGFRVWMERVNVFLSGKRILKNLHWVLGPGENWAVRGPNGSGKSTLLKLLHGDYTPALGGRVRRVSGGAALSVWEGRRKMGFVSAELQASYREPVTVAQTVGSGFYASIGLREPLSPAQWGRVLAVLHLLELNPLACRRIARLSHGEFRKVLLARAIVHEPPLLLLDEPFDGLDRKTRIEMKELLAALTRVGMQLVMVSHHEDDFPEVMTHTMKMENGRGVASRDFPLPESCVEMRTREGG